MNRDDRRRLARHPGRELFCGCTMTCCPGCGQDGLVVDLHDTCRLRSPGHPFHHALMAGEKSGEATP